MRRFINRWCWLCTAIGAVLLLVSATALGQDAHGSVMGFEARDIIIGLLGLLLTILGAFTAGVRSRMDKNESKIDDLAKALADFKTAVAKDYHPKDEVAAQVQEVKRSVEALHGRFDALNFPQVPRG